MVKFHCLRKCPGKKSVKSPIHVGINTKALCANVSSRQSNYHTLFVEFIITSGTSKVCDSMPCTMRPAMLYFYRAVLPICALYALYNSLCS